RSLIGTLGSAGTQVVNNGTLSIGATPATMIVNGAFVQSGSGVLNIPILPSTVPTAGSSFGQVYATGSNGTASLGGTLNLVPTAGFYPTGSIYPVILADKGITGSFASLTGTSLPFVQFVPLGVVTINGTQQAYELQVERTATYSQAIASVATPNQIAVATGFQPMVDYASANLGTDAASLVGLVDLLTIAQAQTFFDSVSPEGYAAYATAMRDQANLLLRKVTLRMTDQNSDHHETGWWLTGSHQFQFGSAQGYETKNGITDVIGGYDLSGPHHVLGLSLGYSYDSLHYAPGSMIGHNAQTQVAIYGAYTLGPIVASGQVGYEFGHIAATKTITIGATTRTATASSPDHLLVAEGTLSLNAKAEGLLISPFVGIEYDHGSITPFTEAGADAADLTVNRIDASRTDLLLGANITRAKGKWRPYARVAYRSELGTDNAGTISAYFNGDTTTSFTVAGLAAARHEIDGDVGMNIVFDDEGGLFLGYQGTYRSDALSSHGVMAGIRLEF
ncbi:MAG: autotransporter domain-containing protein, partial [Betaproteobacteria bacterium]|nr:autotransporter domain-containing protein [Betaproteobacteria bacterium]